jgi:hypothetical protein
MHVMEPLHKHCLPLRPASHSPIILEKPAYGKRVLGSGGGLWINACIHLQPIPEHGIILRLLAARKRGRTG